ncbi:outer membrane lipoprotein carrier protein LolA [Roseivirga sp. BDSF3-8]|uniref:LolA family protein n=1 Tax=Roseivirga sp. BDSF3-8 TaxID=3241598 RepID=UPI00353200C7
MKRLVGILILLFGFQVVALAQYDEKARTILDKMSAQYQKIPSYKADFSYILTNEAEGLNEEFAGKIAVKDNMYRLKMEGQEIINNGETMWTYLEDVNEVNIDYYDPEDGDMSPSKIYTAYKDGFKYIYLDQESAGDVNVVDLVPNDKNSQYYKVRLLINKSNNTLKGWKIFDKAGNVIHYDIRNFNPKANLQDSYFVFNEDDYSDVEVIDLR